MAHQSKAFHSFVVLGFATTLLVGSSQAQLGLLQQRLVPLPMPIVAWTSEIPTDCPFEKSEQFAGIVLTGRHRVYTNADTWYPSWAADGNLYSPWTDGRVGEMRSSSGPDYWTTGHAKITGDDPLRLEVIALGLHKASAEPYGGRYPCGSLHLDGIWYYGTYNPVLKKYLMCVTDGGKSGREVMFLKRTVTWGKFEVTGVKTGYGNIGLAEMAVFAAE